MSNSPEFPVYNNASETKVNAPTTGELEALVNPNAEAEKKRNQLQAVKFGVAGLTIAALTAGGFAFGKMTSGESPAPTPEPSASAPATPGEATTDPEITHTETIPEATPTDDPTNTEVGPNVEKPAWYFEGNELERVEMPEGLEKYKGMDTHKFAAQPLSEKLTYASWLTSYREDFMNSFYTIAPLGVNKPVEVSPDSSALDLLKEVDYTKRMAAYMTVDKAVAQEDGSCGKLDDEAIARTIIATTDYQSRTTSGGAFDTAIEIMQQTNGIAICPSRQAIMDLYSSDYRTITSESRKVIDYYDTPNTTEVSLKYTQEVEGEPKSTGVVLYVVPTTDYKGESTYSVVTTAPYPIK